MGMYDSILIRCHNCEDHIEFQSKAGRCEMRTYYPHDDIPVAIVEDLDGDIASCGTCGERVAFKSRIIVDWEWEWL